MRLLENHADWRDLYNSEVSFAENELVQKSFRVNAPSVVCDIFALPSHNHQTFFVKLISEHGIYKLVFAKAVQNSIWFSEPIYMYTFEEAKRFEEHPMRHGRIVCRAKLVEKSFFSELTEALRGLSDNQPECVTPAIDADFTAVRVYENGSVAKSFFFTDASKLSFYSNVDSEKSAEYFGNLHLTVENLIGIGD